MPVILAVGRREIEDGSVAMRRLGTQGQKVLRLQEAIDALALEATPPDLA